MKSESLETTGLKVTLASLRRTNCMEVSGEIAVLSGASVEECWRGEQEKHG